MQDDKEAEVGQAKGSFDITARIDVPQKALGLIIGRHGSNVNLIQRSTNTKINFSGGLFGLVNLVFLCLLDLEATFSFSHTVPTVSVWGFLRLI